MLPNAYVDKNLTSCIGHFLLLHIDDTYMDYTDMYGNMWYVGMKSTFKIHVWKQICTNIWWIMRTNHFISKITIAHEFMDVFFSLHFCAKLEDSQCSSVVKHWHIMLKDFHSLSSTLKKVESWNVFWEVFKPSHLPLSPANVL